MASFTITRIAGGNWERILQWVCMCKGPQLNSSVRPDWGRPGWPVGGAGRGILRAKSWNKVYSMCRYPLMTYNGWQWSQHKFFTYLKFSVDPSTFVWRLAIQIRNQWPFWHVTPKSGLTLWVTCIGLRPCWVMSC